jgi:hypothetical protein
MLVRLLYASRTVDPRPETIESILAQSRQYNPTSGITGILCYGGGIFLQAIEGGRIAVHRRQVGMAGQQQRAVGHPAHRLMRLQPGVHRIGVEQEVCGQAAPVQAARNLRRPPSSETSLKRKK